MSNLFMLETQTYNCGIAIDPIVPSFVSLIINAIKIIIPIVLIVFGIVEMFKAATANDEKVMKEAQGKLIKRIIYAVLIFFIVAIVQLVFSILGKAGEGSNTTVDKTNINACIKCFTNYSSDCTFNAG